MPHIVLPRGESTEDPKVEARVAECIADALADRLEILAWYEQGLRVLMRLHEDRVTLCDAGCGIDIQGTVESMKPLSEDEVRKFAEEVARDREQE